jgi:hypothetical protein
MPLANEIRPEDYASGRPLDWAGAFQAALNDAKLTKSPIVLVGGKTYAMGSANWPGLRVDSGFVDIRGNGATIRVLALPKQDIFVGGDKSLIRVTETDGIRLKDLNFDLNRLPVTALCTSRCNDIRINGGGAFNGAVGTNSVFAWAMRGHGFSARDCICHDIDFAFRAGHTDAGTQFDNVRLVNNRAYTLNADFLACVGSDIVLTGNVVNGVYSGVALSGYDGTATTCGNVMITQNQFSNYVAHGVQSDLVRSPSQDVKLTNIKISGNSFESKVSTASAFYCYGATDFQFSGNTVKSQRGVTVFNSSIGTIAHNRFLGGSVYGVYIFFEGDAGDVSKVVIDSNIMAMGAGADAITLQTHPSYKPVDIAITNNQISSGKNGVSILNERAVACRVSGNRVSGLTGGYDVRIDARDVDVYDNNFVVDGGSKHYLEWPLPPPLAGSVNVAGRTNYRESYARPSDVTSLVRIIPGRAYTIRATTHNLRLLQGKLHLKAGKNVALSPGNVITFTLFGDGTIHEMSRNF